MIEVCRKTGMWKEEVEGRDRCVCFISIYLWLFVKKILMSLWRNLHWEGLTPSLHPLSSPVHLSNTARTVWAPFAPRNSLALDWKRPVLFLLWLELYCSPYVWAQTSSVILRLMTYTSLTIDLLQAEEECKPFPSVWLGCPFVSCWRWVLHSSSLHRSHLSTLRSSVSSLLCHCKKRDVLTPVTTIGPHPNNESECHSTSHQGTPSTTSRRHDPSIAVSLISAFILHWKGIASIHLTARPTL